MTYFTTADHKAIITGKLGSAHSDHDIERTHNRMVKLQRALSARMKIARMALHPNPVVAGGVWRRSAAAPLEKESMTITFMRSQADAETVERSMGHDDFQKQGALDPCRHPVIEVRLTADHFSIELIVAPDAWYDQRNFVGKFSVNEHRTGLCKLVGKFEDPYYIGFWSGIYPNDMHLTTDKLPPHRILCEFFDTFAAGRDYLRVGRWYDVEDPGLSEMTIEETVFRNICELYTVYNYVLWSGNNNYHKFYHKAQASYR